MDERIQKLANLPPIILAKALVQLAETSETAEETLERLLATPVQNQTRFKRKLAQLKQLDRFIDWREAKDFAEDLAIMLEDLKAGVFDPLDGVKQVAAFYKTDQIIFENCDDSDGSIGWIFSLNAKDLLCEFGSQCSEKEELAEILIDLCGENEYGARDAVIECVGACLPEPLIRSMIATFQELAIKQTNSYDSRHILELVESLARQIKDPKLFQETRLTSQDKDSPAAMIDIAKVYFECGDIASSLAWLEKTPSKDTFQEYEKNSLLMDIYRHRGDKQRLEPLLRDRFRLSHSEEYWAELLDLVGHENKTNLVAQETTFILKTPNLREQAAQFLISIGQIDEVETYLLQRYHQVDGDHYHSLLPLAESLLAHKRFLSASLIYRRLLTSILTRRYTKAYPHGIRYLNSLDQLAPRILDWQQFETHDLFKKRVYQAHHLKRSFWPQYHGDLPGKSGP